MDKQTTTLPVFAISQLPLSSLRFGHEYPAGTVNIRKPIRADGERLWPSIRAEGLLQPLLVLAKDDAAYVIVGGRRLMALHIGRELGELTDDAPIGCVIAKTLGQAEALAKSLAAEDAHVPPHPVDRYEAFAAIAAKGMTPEDIAARFFIDAHVVRQALALGALGPKIRAAWRDGEINADTAQAFTLAKNVKTQEQLYGQLQKQGHGFNAFDVRRKLDKSDHEAAKLVEFIGIEAYRAAGGEVVEDLFDKRHIVADAGLAQSLAQNRLERECQRLTAAGWSWAAIKETLPRDAYQWTKLPGKFAPTPEESKCIDELNAKARRALDELDDQTEDAARAQIDRLETEISARSISDNDRAKSGCIVAIDDDGALQIVYGVVRPKTAEKPAVTGGAARGDADDDDVGSEKTPAKKKTAKAEPSRIPNTLALALSIALTEAADEVLQRSPDLSLAILLAAFAQGNYAGFGGDDRPVQVSCDGLGAARLKLSDSKKFVANLERFIARKPDQNLALLAHVVGAALNFQRADADRPALKVPGIAKLCDAIPDLNKAIVARFPAKDYFTSAPKAFALQAIEEACGPDARKPLENKGKAEIVKAVLASVPQTGWLPVELRTASYVAPKPGKAAAAAKATKPAKKIARK